MGFFFSNVVFLNYSFGVCLFHCSDNNAHSSPGRATVFYPKHRLPTTNCPFFEQSGVAVGRRGLSELSQHVLSLQEAGRPLTSRHPREPVQSVRATQDPRQNASNNPTKCFVGWRRTKKQKKNHSNYNKLCLRSLNCEENVPTERRVGSCWLFTLKPSRWFGLV